MEQSRAETAITDYTPPHAVITTQGLLMAIALSGAKAHRISNP
ncbi:hypothetical protein [Nostoc sp.]